LRTVISLPRAGPAAVAGDLTRLQPAQAASVSDGVDGVAAGG
jgi:hypothetical protein